MRKRFTTAVLGALLVFSLSGCTPAGVAEAQNAINAIGKVSLESEQAIEDANEKYNALSDEDKAKVNNYATLESANKELFEILYAEIKSELEETESLESNYFAQYYDTSGIKAAKEAAESALEASDETKYGESLDALQRENDSLSSYIEEEQSNSYSAATNSGEYPFAVDADEFPQNGALKPTVKRSANYPFQVNLFEPKTTDGLPGIGFCMSDDNGGYSYNYEIAQEEIKEINVEDENGDVKGAFVNTRVVLHDLIGESDDTEASIRESCYLLKSRAGAVYMVLPDLEGGDYYVLYRRS
ncbi:hypothetical protein [Adlercreutzia sp. ZJ242]|uniref:hypothetical protein n=1 Tax=Adlercreutzia sp. ZJ242 TaxID=2709409 RepID=UPI0013EBE2C4|nr:hypothetical protein [Adlercreutzia sp. ZJ242]